MNSFKILFYYGMNKKFNLRIKLKYNELFDSKRVNENHSFFYYRKASYLF